MEFCFFIIGIIGSIWLRPFEWLAIIDVLLAFTGVLFFFKKSKMRKSSLQKERHKTANQEYDLLCSWRGYGLPITLRWIIFVA